jgi:hypothetical protein
METNYWVCNTKSVEEIDFPTIAQTVIPYLRMRIRTLLKLNGNHCFQTSNSQADNIFDRANALAGEIDKMTGQQLNDSVKILRKELYLIRTELQKHGPVNDPMEKY